MKQILLFLISLFLFSCSKEPILNPIIKDIDESTLDDTNLNDNTETSDSFLFIGEEYSNINNTTSHYVTQKTNRYISYDDIVDKLNVTQDSPQVYWHTNNRVTVVDDFDRNGKLDVFGFWFKSTPNYTQGHNEPGKYFLYLDFFTDNPKSPLYWDTELVYACEMFLSDINNDGQNEIVVVNSNTHDDSSLTEKKVEVVYLTSNLNLNISQIGVDSESHDGTLGDVDNDGDVDIVFIPFGGQWSYPEFPLLYRNDGNGNFSLEKLFKNESLETDYKNFSSLAYEVFDLNNDGYLDLIQSSKLNIKRDWYSDPPLYFEVNQEIQIFWGDGSGNYNIENKTSFNVDDNFGYELAVLGYGFGDYDLDGDVDIFITTTRAEDWQLVGFANVTEAVQSGQYYNNYILYAFENTEDGFVDITTDVISDRMNMTLTNYSDFYSIWFMDVDNDGDYDLVPGRNHAWTEYHQSDVLYWEKVGNSFVKKQIDNL